jgi:suppressor of tumorigenicity protein 13
LNGATNQESSHQPTADMDVSSEEGFPPIYSPEGRMEDYEMAGTYKQEAADLVSEGNFNDALEKYTQAVLSAPPSALLYANRATVLYKLQNYRAAERDCNEALKENPDSAKALRTRGKVRKELMMWEEALSDLSASQRIDFDESTVDDLKFLTEKRLESEKQAASERIHQEERLRKKAEDIKRAKEEALQEAAEESKNSQRAPSMPFGGFPGMPGGGGGGMEGIMGALLSDPELMAAMQNPKVQTAFQELMSSPDGFMSNPSKVQEMMKDPEVGPLIGKLMAKLGMGGGVPVPAGDDADDDGIPNLDDFDGNVDLDHL